MRPGLYAFAVAAAFLGATFYIGVIEQPARLKLGGRAMLKEWTFSFHATWTGDLPCPQADAGLGIAGMGAHVDRFRCLLLVRLGA